MTKKKLKKWMTSQKRKVNERGIMQNWNFFYEHILISIPSPNTDEEEEALDDYEYYDDEEEEE